MKKQLSVFSILSVLALTLVLSSCGSKRDEAMVTEFNSKKADADKLVADCSAQAKTMSDEHKAWSANLDQAAKANGADSVKIAGFHAQIKAMDDAMPAMSAMLDSVKSYANAPSETNDQLKAAIAGLGTQMSPATSSCSKMAADHKKLGDDIMAFLGGAAAAAPATPAAPEAHSEAKKPAPVAKQATPPTPPPAPKVMKKSGGGGVIKQ